jgi:hypothetical protein
VHPRNWRPYLACINRAHDDLGLPAPARHRIVFAASKGALRLSEQHPVLSSRPVRRPLPAPVAASAVALAAASSDAAAAAPALAVVTAIVLMVRASSLVALHARHVAFAADGSVTFTVTKHKTRLATTLVRLVPPASPLLEQFIALMRAFVLALSPSAPLFSFGAHSPSAGLSACVRVVLEAAQLAPPPGSIYTGHSCRGGGATAACAIRVPLPVTMAWGDWKSLTSVVRYLDPLCPASPAAVAFFGHLRHS